MSVPDILKGRGAAFVWDPIPVHVDALISGRWTQPRPNVAAVGTVMRKKLDLLEDIWRDGQKRAITARFEIHLPAVPENRWPHLQLHRHREVLRGFGSVEELLSERLLIYEGNHRWAIAKMLQWDYVLVEPRLWVFAERTHHEHWTENCTNRLRGLVHEDFRGKVVAPRVESPKRSDLRPIEPEVIYEHRPFFGNRAWEWISG